ncbi:MAG: VIT domain-containing protein [Betaproteobacteria bacterium]
MRMTWARSKTSPTAAVDRMHFVMWDFLKMFLATVICGIAVSLVAAAIALVLANDAYAAAGPNDAITVKAAQDTSTAQDADELLPIPGMLLIGAGCDAIAVEAIERDWKVTITGKTIDVRVMQTFIVPEGDSTAATFSAVLPTGARLLRLNAHAADSLWQGKVFDAQSYRQISDADFRKSARAGTLIVQNDDGLVSTDVIGNIAATEVVTIEYTYRMTTVKTEDSPTLVVATANYDALLKVGGIETVGTVWVEWIGANPSRIIRAPSGAFLETNGTKITGISWSTRQPTTDTPFQLAWTM